ncbi:MAG: LamG-like jellyroll fold domain-containing protein [Candidatus Micrarchaeaceae archaeon]
MQKTKNSSQKYKVKRLMRREKKGVAAHFAKGAFARAQSAMEYLMTYGWAILIIAVVLSALFELGVFNSNNFAPKAPPGSCQVFRPNGPYTTSFINLEGVCNGELPQYVAYFAGNGANSAYSSNTYITATVQGMAGSNTIFTVTAWIKPLSSVSPNMPFFGFQSYQAFELFRNGIGTTSEELGLHRCSSADTWESTLPVISLNTWNFVAVAVNPPNYYFQLNGNGTTASNTNTYNNNNNVVIGTQTAQCDGSVFAGYLANVQIYNTSLSANEIQALYQEGIGGAPIDLQNLVGWWPLNGNANDYSGNGNNGQATGVTYVSNWYSGYTPP